MQPQNYGGYLPAESAEDAVAKAADQATKSGFVGFRVLNVEEYELPDEALPEPNIEAPSSLN